MKCYVWSEIVKWIFSVLFIILVLEIATIIIFCFATWPLIILIGLLVIFSTIAILVAIFGVKYYFDATKIFKK